MKHALLLLLFGNSLLVFSANNHTKLYLEIANEIDLLENSLIQDFSIDLPRNTEERKTIDYIKAANQLKVKYELQRKLFFKVEDHLFKLELKVGDGNLEPEEIQKLKAKIEYAARIILRSRKNEIHEIYNELKNALSHIPKLKDIFEQIKQFHSQNCLIENIDYRPDVSELQFDVKAKNKFGSWTEVHYIISDLARKSKRLMSRPDLNKYNLPYQSFVTEYWSAANDEGQIEKSFSLQLDNNGLITNTEFTHNTKEPLIQILGFEIGSQDIRKNLKCTLATE